MIKLDKSANTVFLIGAGFSANSGIPTFRGEGGYWKVGSRNYVPEEMGTKRMFKRKPQEVWKWYFHRKEAIRNAKPTLEHSKLAELAQQLGNKLSVISQNVDGLHRLAGVPEEQTYNIHGDMAYSRCFKECSNVLYPFPDDMVDEFVNGKISNASWKKLRCPKCGKWLRPHILWFDECYNEEFYRSETAKKKASNADNLIVIGTTGTTTLPSKIINSSLSRGANVYFVSNEESMLSHRIDMRGGKSFIMDSGEFMGKIGI
jgi:NAD-dependent deacetylase